MKPSRTRIAILAMWLMLPVAGEVSGQAEEYGFLLGRWEGERVITKEVRYEGTADYLVRNRYRFRRAATQEAPWPTAGWSVSTPEKQGLNPAPLAALHEAASDGTFGYVDHLLVVRNGFLVMDERYDNDYHQISQGFEGGLGCSPDVCNSPDDVHAYNYYHPDWHPFYRGGEVHSLQSVTKSVTSSLIGIAIAQGAIGGIDAPVLSLLSDYALAGADERLERATLEDLLTMQLGMEWYENRPFDETNTTLQLEWSEDWVQFTLEQPMEAEPGEKWVYNSGASHLMSAFIRGATGLYVDEFAERHLFGPLGIRDYYWKKTPRRLPDTEGGLFLEAEDLAKFGYLFLRQGEWDGQPIVPADWVEASTARHVDDTTPLNPAVNWGYGYQWWRLDRDGVEVWAGLGFGGQFLLVLPGHDIVAVANSWNIFGGGRSVLGAFLDALIQAAG